MLAEPDELLLTTNSILRTLWSNIISEPLQCIRKYYQQNEQEGCSCLLKAGSSLYII